MCGSLLIKKPRIIIQTVSANTSVCLRDDCTTSMGYFFLLTVGGFVTLTSGHGSELALQF